MAPKFGKAQPTRSKKALHSAGQLSLSADANGSKPKSPLSQLYEQKPFGFSPSSPRSLVARQAVAGLSQDVRVQEMSSYVASRGGASLPVLVPEEPVAAVDSMVPLLTQSSSRAFQHTRSQKTMGASPSTPEMQTSQSFGLIQPELTGYSFRATTGEFIPTKGRRQSTTGAGYRTGARGMNEDGRGLRPASGDNGDRPSTRETVAGLRAEGLNIAENQSRRLAKLTPADSVEEMRGARAAPMQKNLSLPNLHSRHDTEAARVYDKEVDRWLRRLMVDVNISHKSLPESSAQSQICTHLDKVHRWFDRSKKAATYLKESAGEKPPMGPSLKQAGIYLPSGSPAPPGSLHWERPEKPMKLSKSDAASTTISDVTTDPGDITDGEGMDEPLDITSP